MPISNFSIGNYWWLFVVILLVAIGSYSTSGYFINGYIINGH
jgi:hypothetical protein